MNRIAFDAKRITSNATGLGNYSRFVVEALAAFHSEHRYYLCSPGKGNPALYSALQQREGIEWLLPEGRRMGGTFWRNFGVVPRLQKEGIDLFHGLSHELPLGIYGKGIATVVTIHDLIFIRYPHYYKPVDRLLYRLKYGHAARRADRVIAISEQTKRDVMEFFHVPVDRIDVVYQGCSPDFGQATEEDESRARERYALPERYLLYVGSIETRKNLRLAVEALAHCRDRHIRLVAVGKRTPYCAEVQQCAERSGVADRLVMLHDVPFAFLPGIYRGAEVFVYPSRFEGFGIPIVEALASGVPVVAATGSCLEEAGGPSSLYTDPDDAEMMASMLDSILSDSSLREKMIADGRTYIERFSPEAVAQSLICVYDKVLQEKDLRHK